LTAIERLFTASPSDGLQVSVAADGGLAVSGASGASVGVREIVLDGVGCVEQQCDRPVQLKMMVTVQDAAAQAGKKLDEYVVPSPDRVAAAEDLPAGLDAVELADELIVVLGTTSDPGTRAQSAEVAAATGAVVAGGWQDIGIYQLRWVEPQDLDQRISELAQIPAVAGVDRSLLAPDLTAAEPTDWDDYGPDATWHLTQMRAQQAWDLAEGTMIPVGIVDSGLVADQHPDLNVLRSTGAGTGRTTSGHATHVAGLACAEKNGEGVVGAAWGCPIISDSLVGADAYANDDVFYQGESINLSSALGATKRVIEAGARVVNLSVGIRIRGCADQQTATWVQDHLIDDLMGGLGAGFRRIAEGVGSDVVFTLAAGNSCSPGVDSPYGRAADLDNVIAVSAVNSDGKLARFSNWGGEVAAGGGVGVPPLRDKQGNTVNGATGVFSTLPGPAYTYDRDGQTLRYEYYGPMEGTSQAAPLVAGVAALVREQHPNKSAAEIAQCITGTAGTNTGVIPPQISAYPTSANPQITGFPGGIPIVDAEAAVLCRPNLGSAPADNASTLTALDSLSVWTVTDFYGVDCADCGGLMVLQRSSQQEFQLIGLTQYNDGGRSVYCMPIQLDDGQWLDDYDRSWQYLSRVQRLRSTATAGGGQSGPEYWVEYKRVPEEAVRTFLAESPPDVAKDYKICGG
jgi:subtilisin family serine protease